MIKNLNAIVQERPQTRQKIRRMVDSYFAGVPFEGIGKFGKVKGHQIFLSSSNSALFARYAGKSHEQLKALWKVKPSLTTCNGLAGKMFNKLFVSRKRGINGLSFDLKGQCLAKAPLAWVSQANNPTARPGYGDIMSYKAPALHASISLGAQLKFWTVIQSGQGGSKVGADIIAKGKEDYPINRIVGWINVAILWDYEEMKREHRSMQKAWSDSPWDALIRSNRRRR